jgi:hypothetical protein
VLSLVEHIVLGRPGTVAIELEGDCGERVACVDLELGGPDPLLPRPSALEASAQ